MGDYDCGPNFDSLFTAAESKNISSDSSYNVECYVTVSQNIDRQQVCITIGMFL